MRYAKNPFLKTPKLIFWAFVLSIVVSCGVSNISAAVLKGITTESPSRLRLQVTEKVPSKVILVDEKEVLIALKSIHPESEKGSVPLAETDLFRSVEIEKLPGEVLAVLVTGRVPFSSTAMEWDASGKHLVVDFFSETVPTQEKKNVQKDAGDTDLAATAEKKQQRLPSPLPDVSAPQSSVPEKRQDDDASATDSSLPPTESGESGSFKDRIAKRTYGSPKNKIEGKAGDISDLVYQIDGMTCSDDDLKKAVLLLKQGQWDNAYQLLETYLSGERPNCLEKAEILKAYAFYQSIDGEDYGALLQAETMFQSILVGWPETTMRPFCHTALGLIYDRLSNGALAEGHFTIVMDEFKEYSGLPEVIYHLGRIYDQKEFNEKALEQYQEVFEKYPDSVYAVAAGVGLGKALFKKRHYIDSSDILTTLSKSNPEIIYDSPDVLLSLGDAEFALGRNASAREVLGKVYNLFADLPDKDLVMTRIADTFANQKKLERAKKVYGFVMEKYPGTNGYLESAMGLALCLKDRQKIEELYNMVKTDFADHRLSRVAMMRLAELYHREGEYERCIEEVETLLATHPTGLRYDAVKLMQRAYEALFGEKLESGAFTDLLKTYEGAKVLLDRLESRIIFMLTGLAYGEAKLFEQAYQLLYKAYQDYPPQERPSKLLWGIGVAMDETDRDDEAVEVLKTFVDKVDSGPEKVTALIRLGKIMVANDRIDEGRLFYKTAFDISQDRIEKGDIMGMLADLHTRTSAWSQVIARLEQALTEYASAPGENYDRMSKTYKALGKAHLEQEAYVKAAEGFTMALKFAADAGQTGADITFMLGDAYQKANAIDKAKETFQKVAETEDSIWARLARERLSTLSLAETLSNS